MAENPRITLTRKIDQLEREAREIDRRKIGYTLSDVFSLFQMTIGLRGFWPFSSIIESGAAVDLAFQNRYLSNVNSISRNALASGMPYCTLNGTNQYWTRADEAALDFTTQFTIGGWFYPTTAGTFIAKLGAQYSYLLDTSGGYLRLIVSSTGADAPQLVSSAQIPLNRWNFLVGRFLGSQQMAVYLNNVKTLTTTGIISSCFNSTVAFTVGARATANFFTAGNAALCFASSRVVLDPELTRLYEYSRPFFGV